MRFLFFFSSWYNFFNGNERIGYSGHGNQRGDMRVDDGDERRDIRGDDGENRGYISVDDGRRGFR